MAKHKHIYFHHSDNLLSEPRYTKHLPMLFYLTLIGGNCSSWTGCLIQKMMTLLTGYRFLKPSVSNGKMQGYLHHLPIGWGFQWQ